MLEQFIKSLPEDKQRREREAQAGHGYFRDETLRQQLFRRLQTQMVQRRMKAEQMQKAARDEEL